MKKLLVILLIAALLVAIYFLSGFYGNPISSMLGKSKAEKFVQKNYSDEYKYEETKYDFKTSKYHHKFRAENSSDKHFTVSTNFWGKVKYDDYEIMKKGFHTFIRFEKELREITDPIIESNFDKSSLTYGFISSKIENYEGFPLDSKFSLDAIPKPLSIDLHVQDNDTSYVNLAKQFLKVEDMAIKNNLDLGIYSILITGNEDATDKSSVHAFYVPYDEWKESSGSVEELAAYLEEYSIKYDEENENK
ncbi:hypothetical protein [Microaceticoccus formicicus]|uniref:YfjL-like protein n=1 Tax=Microaceticoccus formicicus TaxID=3118105 RepID=UPI003CD00FE4|nr:hypothetical protein VZL98_00485 [Peptoniphilaceae bacterium AMB_02]